MVLIDPIWDETVRNDRAYLEINIDVFSPQVADLCEIERDYGQEVLKEALMNYARYKSPKELRKNYIKNREEYQNCIRI